MSCKRCKHWILARGVRYEDGTEKILWSSTNGKGQCNILKIDTDSTFNCASFSEGSNVHRETIEKKGTPWQNWVMGDCPECNGRGCHMVEMRPACRRCGGMGKVRHYDDGYIADTTWDHPREKELKKRQKQGLDPGLIGTVLQPVEKKDDGFLT